MIDPGQMRTKLIYQEAVPSDDDPYNDNHGANADWSDVATVWARVRALSGREVFYASQVQSEETHEVICRHRPGIKPTGRFRVAGTDRYLHIAAPPDDFESRRIWLKIKCVERWTPEGTAT